MRQTPAASNYRHKKGEKYRFITVYDLNCQIIYDKNRTSTKEIIPFIRALSLQIFMKFKDIAGCVGTTTLLLLASIGIPFIGPLFSLLIPLVFLYYSSKLGFSEGLKIVAVTLIIIGLVGKAGGYPRIMLFCLEFSLLGLIISELFRRQLAFDLTIFWGTGIMLFIGFIFIFLIGLSKGMGPVELIFNYFQSNLNITIQAYQKMDLDQEKGRQLQEFGKVFIDIISRIYPALIITSTACVVWLNVIISKPLFRLGSLKYPDFGPLDRWQAPERMIWVVIASGFALFFPSSGLKFIALNILIVSLVIYVFHGISIILFFLNKYKVPLWIRIGIYILLVFQQFFLAILAVAGLFDQWIDFRKISLKKKNKEENL